jgi:paraquat-inducible protein B
MAARANYVKLGLFVIIGLVAALVLGITAGALELRRETTPYTTYFTEAVEGLDVGAPVKARGVTIGRVGKITFAPDHEHVEVRMDFDVANLKAMGLQPGKMPPNVRAQLASPGLVGTRFVALDIFDPATHPAPPLGFTPAGRYIPSTQSVQKSLEASASKALDRLAQLADTLVEQGFAEKASGALTDIDRFVIDADRTLGQIDRERLPARTAKAIDDARVTVGKLSTALERIGGNAGVIATAERAFASVGAAGRSASAASGDVQGALDELRSAAAAIRELAEQIQQNPDMLVKGRRKP